MSNICGYIYIYIDEANELACLEFVIFFSLSFLASQISPIIFSLSSVILAA